MRKATYTLFAAFLTTGGGLSASAQSIIGSALSCPTCSIGIEHVARIEGVEFHGPATTIARSADGNSYYVVDPADQQLKIYEKGGKLVRQIGRKGGGPGEYELLRNVLVGDDGTLHTLDAMLGRHSTFSAQGDFLSSNSIRLARGVGLPALVLGDKLIVNVRGTNPTGSSAQLVMIDAAGHAVPLESAPSDRQKPWLDERLLWHRSNGQVLVARPYSFTIDVLSKDLRRTETLKRTADWTPDRVPDEMPSDGIFDKPFSTRLSGLWEDAESRVWLMWVVRAAKWEPRKRDQASARMTPEERMSLSQRPRVETIIEVVDLGRRRVIARTRFPGPVGLPFGGGYLARLVEDTNGEPVVEISRLRISP